MTRTHSWVANTLLETPPKTIDHRRRTMPSSMVNCPSSENKADSTTLTRFIAFPLTSLGIHSEAIPNLNTRQNLTGLKDLSGLRVATSPSSMVNRPSSEGLH